MPAVPPGNSEAVNPAWGGKRQKSQESQRNLGLLESRMSPSGTWFLSVSQKSHLWLQSKQVSAYQVPSSSRKTI